MNLNLMKLSLIQLLQNFLWMILLKWSKYPHNIDLQRLHLHVAHIFHRITSNKGLSKSLTPISRSPWGKISFSKTNHNSTINCQSHRIIKCSCCLFACSRILNNMKGNSESETNGGDNNNKNIMCHKRRQQTIDCRRYNIFIHDQRSQPNLCNARVHTENEFYLLSASKSAHQWLCRLDTVKDKSFGKTEWVEGFPIILLQCNR